MLFDFSTGLHRTGLRLTHRVAPTASGSPHPHATHTLGTTTPTGTHTYGIDTPHRDAPPPTGPASTQSHLGYSNYLRRMWFHLLPPLLVCTHTCGAHHPHLQLVHPILGVLTHIIDLSPYSFMYVFVYVTSSDYGRDYRELDYVQFQLSTFHL